MRIGEILSKYNLPSINDIINDPPSKEELKVITSPATKDYWNAEIAYEARSKSSLKHLNISNMEIGKPHQV